MSFRIFVDLKMPDGALALLRRETADHQLLLPEAPAQSVLAQGAPDPLLRTAEIAFGQPDTKMIAEAAELRWVHVSSSGVTRYDTPEFRALAVERGFTLSNSALVYQEPCALHALSFLLAQARSLPSALGQRIAGGTPAWDDLRESAGTLEGQSIVIVGYGAIGKRLVEMVRPLGMRVVAYRRRPRGDEAVRVVASAELGEVLAQADHVMNILPASAETSLFFDEKRFASMKPGAVFYNIGRGSTVDQDALLQQLRKGRLRAAWLDVTDPEPLPQGHPLLDAPGCHITPHTAGGHARESESLVRHFVANLRRFERGEPLVDRVL